jgi:hypothetical protein
MLLRTPSLYIYGFGINLPTSSLDMASNWALDPPIMAKIHYNPKISTTHAYLNCTTHAWQANSYPFIAKTSAEKPL